MFIIQEILVSEALIKEDFVCNLNKCKGACCWEGDYGAPLEAEEVETLSQMLPLIRPYLTTEGRKGISEQGPLQYYAEPGFYGTTLLENGACAFMTLDEAGTAQCGIERAHTAGAIDWKKPVSCHLYPVRVKKIEHMNFEALNYDRWDICTAACQLGEKLQVPIYQFVKDALIRKYGEAFWQELDEVASDLNRP